ncbi:MAG: glycosyltransferase family 39 protein [Candidatus Aenigmatarchaeota archaeon]
MEIKYKKKQLWYVLLFAVVITSLVINLSVSLTEPLVFGDEGYYAARGEYIAENLEIPKYRELYGHSEVFDSYMIREPNIFFTLSSFFLLAGEMGMKFFTPFISLVSSLLVFLLARKLHSVRAGFFSALFYLVLPAITTYSIFLYREHLALMFLLASVYILYKYFENEDNKLLYTSGFLFGFSILSEPVALFAIPLYLVILSIYKVGWRDWLREVIIISLLSFVVISPWMLVHNYSQTGNFGFKVNMALDKIPGINVNFEKQVFRKDLIEKETAGLKGASEVGKGTHGFLYEYGVLSYIQFAYSLPIFIFAILGLSYYFTDMKKKYWILILWAFLLFFGPFLTARMNVETLSRNTLLVTAPIAILGGTFISKLFEYFENFETTGKIISISLLIILLVWSLFAVYTKAGSIRSIKHFSNSFFKGCDWIRENTEEDALVYTLWGHRADYHCKRSTLSNNDPGMEDAIVSADNYTYRVFKEHGIDYLYIQKFSIKQGREATSYPLSFIQYIERDPHYKKVYSNPNNCLYSRNQNDCVVVYEFLTEDEMDSEKPQLKNPLLNKTSSMGG